MGNDFGKGSGVKFLNNMIEEKENLIKQFPEGETRVVKRRSLVKKLTLGLTLFLGLIGIFGAVLIIPAKKVLADVSRVKISAKDLLGGFKEKNLNKAREANEKTKKNLESLALDLKAFRWLGTVPFVRNYYQDSQRLLKAGETSLEVVTLAIEGIQPYADIIGFSGAKKGEGTTAEDRINFFVTTIDKIKPQLEEINRKVEVIDTELSQIDPNRYPEEVRGEKIRSQIKTITDLVHQIHFLLQDGRPVMEQASWLLGEDAPRKYLLLFQNDAELRPTGGFLTAYAILEVFKGKIKPLFSEDIYSLDARFTKRIPAPEPILKYLPKVYYWNLRDMNLSPDFSVSMATFSANYYQVPAVPKVDGIVAVDTKVLVKLLEILGPIGVSDWGNFSAKPDNRCSGCPQVVYELERLADKPVSEIRASRKAVLGPLMHSVLQNAMQSPKDKLASLFNAGFSLINEKHILFYFFDPEIQKAFESFNMAGRIRDFAGDYFLLNDCNFAGAKSNLFVKEAVEQKIEVGTDGGITKEVIVNYKNPAPPSNCNLEKGELCLNGLYRNWFRFYVPKGSTLIESSGSEVEVKTSEDLGKTVFEGFYGDSYPLRPLGSAKLIFKYKLPFKVNKGEDYRLFIQKQPGTEGYQYTVIINGQKEEFELKTDKELKFKM